MAKIAVSAKGVDVSDSVRGVKGKVSLRPDAVSLGINIGIGEIGVTTDYGGAGKISIAGQSVTWGVEGGKIELGVGGFEVKVEARDCVVTETKKIFGQVVATRTYPDPGCDPKPPSEVDSPIPQPPPVIPPGGTGLEGAENSQQSAIVSINSDNYFYVWSSRQPLASITKYRKIQQIFPPLPTVPYSFREGLNYTEQSFRPPPNPPSPEQSFTAQAISWLPTIGLTYTNDPSDNSPYSRFCAWLDKPLAAPAVSIVIYNDSRFREGIVYFGSLARIHKYIETSNRYNEESRASQLGVRYGGSSGFTFMTAAYVLPIGNIKTPPFLPTGNKPIMDNCCKEILADLEDIKEALAVDRILKDKFPVSNSFMAPGVDASSKTEAKDYYEIAQCVVRMMAHGMIFEPEAVIRDADSAKAGNQSLKVRYVNATGWAKAMSEAMFEVLDDGNVATNMDLRNGFTVTQSLVALVDVVNKLDAILDVMGVTLKPKTEKVTTAFNCMIQAGKGFGKNNEKQLDLNADESTEALIPEFLKTRVNTIKTVEIHPRSESLFDILRRIEASLPRQE